MDFKERINTLLKTPALPLTWDSILKECKRIEDDYVHIRSEFQWALEYKRFQVEDARRNRSAGLLALKAAIAAAPDNSDILGDYKNYVSKPAVVENIVLIVSSKKTEANAVRLAAQFDKVGIQYLIVSGSETSPIEQIRALQVDAADSYEARPKKVAAALAWIYENLGSNVGVLKVDDEMTLQDAGKLQRSLTRMSRENFYAGVPVQNSQFDRCAHWGKCQDPAMNRRVYGRPLLRPWANGSAYYLGPGPLEKVVIALMRFPGLFDGEYYEDKLMGDVLVFEGVDLTALSKFQDLGLNAPGSAELRISTGSAPAAVAPRPAATNAGLGLKLTSIGKGLKKS
ncbi:MAG: hypothetical protein JWP38_2924 [Herbaspirillum sp.]|nr:hypothetical protein [Herbaspirillum sp.]